MADYLVFEAVVVALLAEGVDRNFLAQCLLEPVDVALLAEGVDRNCACLAMSSFVCASPSSRRAWIEIRHKRRDHLRHEVALLAEGVDRNSILLMVFSPPLVALLAEGVDRNSITAELQTVTPVALLAEGVDRNSSVPGCEAPRP